jgi:hypothetical protein
VKVRIEQASAWSLQGTVERGVDNVRTIPSGAGCNR